MDQTIGRNVRRTEDFRFLTGGGRFVDDINFPGIAYAHVVRSPHAHARIRKIDTTSARNAPGVLSVLTAADVQNDGLGELQSRYFPSVSIFRPTHPILTSEKVRFVGDRVALVVADTLYQARDAAELIEIDYEVLPAIVRPEDALSPEAIRVWDEARSNLCFEIESGPRAKVDAAFADAAHISKIEMKYPRAAANPIEPRATIGQYDRFRRRYTLYSATQAPYRVRDMVAAHVLHIAETDLRVVAPDVGGAFGTKGTVYPEDALVVWAAGKVNRPVRWTADRSESFLSDMQGRDLVGAGELALDDGGRILAIKVRFTANVGAYLGYAAGSPAMAAITTLSSVYDVPLLYASARAVFTNTAPLGPYRGSGRPEAAYIIERLIDKAAREMEIDRIEVRRRNIIPAEAMPYRTAANETYDTGDFGAILEKALSAADWNGFPQRRLLSEKMGLCRGIGLAMHCARSGLQSERMEMRVDQNGSISLFVGTLSTGQGHETMFAQMVSEWLSVPMETIRIMQGDTDQTLFGRGTFAARSMTMGGSALKLAADDVIRKGKLISAWMLDAQSSDVEFEGGLFRVVGTNRSATLKDVAQKSYSGAGLPAELGLGLDGVGISDAPPNYPNGCYICELEIDRQTGVVTLEKMTVVEDVGTIVNPLALEGQLIGSIAQAYGQVLGEHVVYDQDSGQLLSGSFMDYGMPRAQDIPPIDAHFASIPATTNLLGVKGGSESGNIAAPPAIVNAIVDAMAPFGVIDLALPIRPEQIWRAANEEYSARKNERAALGE
jgi:carbon-monoxide dehydrogenase large subunit